MIGFFNGSVAPASRPRPCRTFLLCPQSRVFSVPPLLPSSLTGPLDALCTSAFPVNSSSLMTVSALHLSPPVPPAPAPPPDNEPPADWFSHGPPLRFPSLYGWGRGDPTPPGSGTQSWLFCPLISWACSRGIASGPSNSTGHREQVPSEKSQFWTAHALPIIRAYADHFHSLDRRQPAAALL